MSILIKGMEMPTNCFLCPLSVLNGERLFCEVTKDEVLRAKRSSDCPLVPVPPHGRLIDADALIADDWYLTKIVNGINCAWTESKKLKDVPTIIPADKEET